MTSTNFMTGLGDNGKTSSKVLRPPGGGSSDIFGSETPNTPRSVRNHMASNIFGSTTDAVVKNSGDAARRNQKNADSYSRLFGEPERPFTPAKNHMKSSIPIGPNVDGRGNATTNNPTVASIKNNVPAATNGSSAHVNGNGIEKNGKCDNGDQHNNVTKTALAKALPATMVAVPLSPEPNNSEKEEQEQEQPQEIPLTNTDGPTETALSSPRSAVNSPRNNGIINNNTENGQPVDEPKMNGIIDENPSTNGNVTSDTTNNLKPVEINGNISENTSTNTSTAPSSAVSPTPSNASNATSNIANNHNNNNIRLNSARSPRFPSRNPVTGMGIEIPDQRPRRLANRRDGNPVTGEGYKPAGAEINTSIPCLNGANQVINKNRIPPGGYSSGLW